MVNLGILTLELRLLIMQESSHVLIPFVSESENCSVVSSSLRPHELYSPWNSPGQNTRVGSLSLLQGIFLTQESNQGLLHCRQILYQLSYQGSPVPFIAPDGIIWLAFAAQNAFQAGTEKRVGTGYCWPIWQCLPQAGSLVPPLRRWSPGSGPCCSYNCVLTS